MGVGFIHAVMAFSFLVIFLLVVHIVTRPVKRDEWRTGLTRNDTSDSISGK